MYILFFFIIIIIVCRVRLICLLEFTMSLLLYICVFICLYDDICEGMYLYSYIIIIRRNNVSYYFMYN